jgi:Tol biopolymer transport system component
VLSKIKFITSKRFIKYFIFFLILIILLFIHFSREKEYRYSFNSYPFSPDGKYIIFSFKADRKADLYCVDIATLKEIKKITCAKKGEYFKEPSYSPDGKKIAYSMFNKKNDKPNLYVMDADGTDVKQITNSKDNDCDPIFSNDGKTIYFVKARYFGNFSPIAQPYWHKTDVFSVNADGTNEKAITDKKYYSLGMIGIYDDKYLLAAIDETDSPYGLWKISLAESDKREPIMPNIDKYKADIKSKPWAIKPLDYDSFGSPSLSFEKKYLVFIWAGHYQGYYGHEIYRMNIKTGETIKITKLKTYIKDPFMLPDGRFIFQADFNHDSSEAPSYRPYTVDQDGSNLQEIKTPLKGAALKTGNE